MFFSVKSLSRAQHVTEDAKSANSEPRTTSTRYKYHVGQDVSNTISTDRSQDSRGATGKRSSKVLFMELVKKQPNGNLLILFCGSSSSFPTRSRLQKIAKCFRGATGHGGCKEVFLDQGHIQTRRTCSCALKGMGLGLEGRFVRCANGGNKTQHRNRIDLKVA